VRYTIWAKSGIGQQGCGGIPSSEEQQIQYIQDDVITVHHCSSSMHQAWWWVVFFFFFHLHGGLCARALSGRLRIDCEF
jgi:hypothetical protein